MRVALEWLAALHQKDMVKLAASSRLPFVQEGFDRCSAKRAANPGDLTVLLGCVANSDQIFAASIPADPPKALADWHVIKSSDVARANKKTGAALAKKHIFVGGTIDGDGVSYQVVIAVTKDGSGVGGILLEANLSE